MPLPTVANPALDSSLGAFSEKYVVPLWTNHFKSGEYAVQVGAELICLCGTSYTGSNLSC